jgi:hypothetical protein
MAIYRSPTQKHARIAALVRKNVRKALFDWNM